MAHFVGDGTKPRSVWSITGNSRHGSAANHGDTGLTREADDKSACVFTVLNNHSLLVVFIPSWTIYFLITVILIR